MSLRFFIAMEESFSLKRDVFHLQCCDLYPYVVCNVETWLDNSVLDNELTISGYCLKLVRLDIVVEYCCTIEKFVIQCHIYGS